MEIPAGAKTSEPLHLRFASGDVLSVNVGDDADATIVEECHAGASKEWSHSVDIRVGADATVTYIAVQTLDDGVQCVMKHTAQVQERGSIHWHVATLGGKHVDHKLSSRVDGEGGESGVDWLFYAADDERQTLSVRNIFAGKNGGGEVMMQGVAQDRGHAKASGLIEIAAGGGGTNTYLTQAVLMLDATAKVDAIPGLEIKTNDVKASHSATVARVSAEDLFYFAARGIAEREARRMYIEGFLGVIAQRIPDASTCAKVMEAIGGKYAS